KNARPVTLEGETCDSPVTQRVLRIKKERKIQEEGEEGAVPRSYERAAGSSETSSSSATNFSASSRSKNQEQKPTPKTEPVSAEIVAAFQALNCHPFGDPRDQQLLADLYAIRDPKTTIPDFLEDFFQAIQSAGRKISKQWVKVKRCAE